jgi:integrative and conjugative element protein (TIGR02256 family)
MASTKQQAPVAPGRHSKPQLNESLMLLLAPGVQEAIKEETSAFAANNMETGGILVGKWLDRQTILIVAATDAGPNADHRQLTFAIDVDYANEELGRIASHFDGVDYVGDWHKHPPILEYPSSGDLSTILSMFRDPTTPDRLVTPISVYRNGKPLLTWFYISRSTRQFERLRPKILNAAELRQVINVTTGDSGYAPRAQVKEKAPGWWLSPTGIFRLKQEADLLGRAAQVVYSQPEGGHTFIFEVEEDGLKIQFQCGGQYDQG